MEFNQSILTQKGRTLMAKAISGRANIVFTKMQSSSTQYQMTQLEMLTSLSNVKQRADVVAEKNNGVTVKVKGTFDNYNLNSGYDFRTVGLYANDPDEGEILYSVSTTSVSGYMPPNTGISATGIDITFYVEVGNADKVHLEIDPAGFATKAELRALEINVAYADDASGGGFSRTDSAKLFKGYGIKNSNLPSDYRWERNVDSLAKDMKLQKTVGDNLIVNGYGDFGDNTNFNNYVFDSENRYNNNPIFKINKKGTYSICNERIPIDINKSYEFSMNLKSDNGGRIYLGWVEYDIDGFTIVAKHAMGFSQTTTSLIKDLNNGDTVVYLESTSNWVDSAFMYQNGLIFWNYKDSTGYTYPEGVYSRNSWADLYSSSDVNKSNNTIKLKEPWNKGTIPAGTKVSQTNDQGYKYRNFENKSVPQSWTHTSFEIGKDHKLQSPYQIDVTRFNPATRSISFVALLSYQDAIADTYYINSIEFKSIDNKLLLLDSNPINSVLTTLSQENPSTKLGGTWTQLGTEQKFSQTIYYWQRTQ